MAATAKYVRKRREKVRRIRGCTDFEDFTLYVRKLKSAHQDFAKHLRIERLRLRMNLPRYYIP